MALLGLELIGLTNSRGTQEIKKLIVYVEIDRCAKDAISYVTGVQLGRRSLKCQGLCPHGENFHTRQLEAYNKILISRSMSFMSDSLLLTIMVVNCGGITDTLMESEFFRHVKGHLPGL